MSAEYNLHTIDLHFQGVAQCIASYIIETNDGLVMIETGPETSRQHALDGLAHLGFKSSDVNHVLLTHIHFDHAGAAGWWAQQGAHVYVHYFGAKHIIDPSKLIASATRIYGDKMDTLWGDILPAPAENVTELHDQDVIEVGGLKIIAHETPGHARHHHVFQLGDIAFTGDAAGIKLPNYELLDLPAPPPEFDLEVWQATVDKLLAFNFRAIYPTHFGENTAVSTHLNGIKALINESANFVKERMDVGQERDLILAEYETWNRERALASGLSNEAIDKFLLVNPLYMSVDGIMRYWRKREQ